MGRLIFWAVFVAACFIGQGLLGRKISPPVLQVAMQDQAFNVNQKILSIFHLGQKPSLVSFLWIKTLLDSDLEHYKRQDLNSWMYLRFQAITDLSPLFLEAYQFGGQYLSVIKDDEKGASQFFLKGLSFFPDDLPLLKSAGYHFLFEDKNENEALKVYAKLAKVPELPPHFKSTYARLLQKGGWDDDYDKVVQEIIDSLPAGSPFLDHFKKKLNLTK